MQSATVHPAAVDAETVHLGSGPRLVLVFVLRSLADRIEDGGRAPAGRRLDIGLAVRQLPQGALADATRRAYAGALRRLERWLAGRRLDDDLLAAYLGELFGRGLAPANAKLVVHAVRRAVADCARGRRAPCSENPAGPATGERLERFRREAGGRGTGQVRGVSWEEADGMCERAEARGDLLGLRDAAMVAVASHCLLRVSEVSDLDAADVSFRPDGTALARVRRSKTDQHDRGAVQYVCADAAMRLRRWTEAGGVRSGALFRPVARGGRVSGARLGPDSVRAVIKRCAAEAGIGGRVSGHSLRIGSAESPAERGVSLPELQTAGRWKSPAMPGRYVRGQEAARGAVARLRGGVSKKSEKALAPPGTAVLESG